MIILWGKPGTGKTSLPNGIADAIGGKCITIPVQPNWTDNQDLLGFYNVVEKRYVPTLFLDTLVEARENPEQLYLVVLDEMNLAHIELYFSDLLSKLEERRGENKDVFFEVDLGAGNEKYKVCLTENVKWVGTMNEDETTKSLSDKVIDRGNVISFPRPEKFERYAGWIPSWYKFRYGSLGVL